VEYGAQSATHFGTHVKLEWYVGSWDSFQLVRIQKVHSWCWNTNSTLLVGGNVKNLAINSWGEWRQNNYDHTIAIEILMIDSNV